MKKLSLLVGAVVLSTAVFAQKPTEGAPMTLEGQIGLTGGLGGSTLAFSAPALRFRYFVTDNIAARVTLGFNNSSTTNNASEFPDGTGNSGKATFKNNNFGAAVGAEYHFTGTAKLSPYVGLDIKFGAGNVTADHTNSTGGQGAVTYVADHTEKSTAKSGMFGVALVAGTDYYFAENFYLGLELGLGFMSYSTKAATTTVTNGNVSATGTAPASTNNSFSNNNALISNFRLGWRF